MIKRLISIFLLGMMILSYPCVMAANNGSFNEQHTIDTNHHRINFMAGEGNLSIIWEVIEGHSSSISFEILSALDGEILKLHNITEYNETIFIQGGMVNIFWFDEDRDNNNDVTISYSVSYEEYIEREEDVLFCSSYFLSILGIIPLGAILIIRLKSKKD